MNAAFANANLFDTNWLRRRQPISTAAAFANVNVLIPRVCWFFETLEASEMSPRQRVTTGRLHGRDVPEENGAVEARP